MLKALEELCQSVLFKDAIVKGSPHKVFRKCGNPSCKCAKDPNQRHGPYTVVIVVEKGRQRQYHLRKDQEKIWKQINDYRSQLVRIKECKDLFQEIIALMEEVIEKRTVDFKK